MGASRARKRLRARAPATESRGGGDVLEYTFYSTLIRKRSDIEGMC